MNFPHLKPRAALTRPEFVLIRIFTVLLVELFQFVAIATVPDAVANRMPLKIQHLIDLEIIWICREYIQPAPQCPLYIFIQLFHPFHLFSSSLNPIMFRYGIHPYCCALTV